MISIILNPKERIEYLMSGTLSKVLALVMLSGFYLLFLSFSGESTINQGARLNGGLVLIAVAFTGLVLSYRKVKKLHNVLTDASVTTAVKCELTPAAFSVHHNQVHEVAYSYEVNDIRYPVFLMTFWHNSCKPEEPVVYANTDHSESVLMRRLPDSLVSKINQQSARISQLTTA